MGAMENAKVLEEAEAKVREEKQPNPMAGYETEPAHNKADELHPLGEKPAK